MWHWLTGAVKYGMWRGNWKVEKITLMFEDIQNSAYELSILPLIFAVLTHFFTSCLLVSVHCVLIHFLMTIFDLPFIYFFSRFILDMQIHTVSSSYIFHKVIYLYARLLLCFLRLLWHLNSAAWDYQPTDISPQPFHFTCIYPFFLFNWHFNSFQCSYCDWHFKTFQVLSLHLLTETKKSLFRSLNSHNFHCWYLI